MYRWVHWTLRAVRSNTERNDVRPDPSGRAGTGEDSLNGFGCGTGRVAGLPDAETSKPHSSHSSYLGSVVFPTDNEVNRRVLQER